MKLLEEENKIESKAIHYFLTLGLIVGTFIIIGYLPMYIALYTSSANINELADNAKIAAFLGSNTFFTLILFPFIVVLLTVLFGVKYIHKKPVLSLFTTRDSFDWKRFLFSFSVWSGIMTIFFIISILIGAPIVWNLNLSTFFMLFLISFFILPLQTTCEEVLFRGYLFQGFNEFFKKGLISVLFTGVLFGLMHSSNPEVEKIGMILLIFYIMNGIFLGLIRLMDGGLELTMGYHAANNIFAALIVTNDWQAFHTDAMFIDKSLPSFGVENVLILVLIQPLLLFLFSKKYKWTNWRERLFN